MKHHETLLNTTHKKINGINGHSHDQIGYNHIFTGLKTPMKSNAFQLPDAEKKYRIAGLFSGLNPSNKPEVTLFSKFLLYSIL